MILELYWSKSCFLNFFRNRPHSVSICFVGFTMPQVSNFSAGNCKQVSNLQVIARRNIEIARISTVTERYKATQSRSYLVKSNWFKSDPSSAVEFLILISTMPRGHGRVNHANTLHDSGEQRTWKLIDGTLDARSQSRYVVLIIVTHDCRW